MSDILPSSVFIPVFTTIAVAVPETTNVPLKTIDFLSPITASEFTASVFFCEGTDSPVSADVSRNDLPEVMIPPTGIYTTVSAASERNL
jgi:hypothetical protein